MEALSLILTAVVAGESKTEAGGMQSTVEDDFTSLHAALRTRLAGHQTALTALEQYIDQPEKNKAALVDGLNRTGAANDQEVLRLAHAVMRRIDPEGSATGNYEL